MELSIGSHPWGIWKEENEQCPPPKYLVLLNFGRNLKQNMPENM